MYLEWWGGGVGVIFSLEGGGFPEILLILRICALVPCVRKDREKEEGGGGGDLQKKSLIDFRREGCDFPWLENKQISNSFQNFQTGASSPPTNQREWEW